MSPDRFIPARIGRFAGVSGWLVGVLRRSGWLRLAAVPALSFVGVFFQAAAFGVVVLFVKVQTSDDPIVVLGLEITSRLTPVTVSAWTGLVLLGAFLSAAGTYAGEVLSFAVGRRAAESLQTEAIALLVRGQREPLRIFRDGTASTDVRRVLSSDATAVVRTSLVLGRLTVSGLSFLVYAAILLALSLPLTVLVFALLLVSLLPLYWVNRNVVDASRAYETHRTVRARVVWGLLDYSNRVRRPGDRMPAWADVFDTHPARHLAVDALRGIILARRRVAFLQQLLFGAVLGAVLVLYVLVVDESRGWGPLITYLVAFRFAAANMAASAAMLTAFNRFLPQLARMQAFLTGGAASGVPRRAGAAGGASEGAAVTAPDLILRPTPPLLAGSETESALAPHEVAFVITPGRPDAYTLPFFCRGLTRHRGAATRLHEQAALLAELRRTPPIPLRAHLTGDTSPAAERRANVDAVIAVWGLEEVVASLPAGLDTPLDDPAFSALPIEARAAVGLAAATLTESPVVLIPAAMLHRLAPAERDPALTRLRERHTVLLLSESIPTRAPEGVDVVVVMYDDASRGVGDPDWYAGLDHDALAKRSGYDGRNAATDDDDDDDLEDDEA